MTHFVQPLSIKLDLEESAEVHTIIKATVSHICMNWIILAYCSFKEARLLKWMLTALHCWRSVCMHVCAVVVMCVC